MGLRLKVSLVIEGSLDRYLQVGRIRILSSNRWGRYGSLGQANRQTIEQG